MLCFIKTQRCFILFLLIPFYLYGQKKCLSNEQWQPTPWVTQDMLDRGLIGGEGGQWPLAMAIDNQEGEFLLWGTDVGGIARSWDGGKTWQPCNSGYNARGSCGFAIDPNNSNRALAVAANSAGGEFHGIYLTTDKALTWKHVLPANTSGYRDIRPQITFDPTSFDKKANLTKIAYWSRTDKDVSAYAGYKPIVHPALYKSINGGETWSELYNSSEYGGCILKIHPTKGYVYLAGKKGLFISTDGAVTFSNQFKAEITGMDVSKVVPDNVYILTKEGVFISKDCGKTFEKIQGKRFLNEDPRHLSVSPVNPNRMMYQDCRETSYYTPRFWTADGGKSWSETRWSMQNGQRYSINFIPFNAMRQGYATWHPKKEKEVWLWASDWIEMSNDGGANLCWANNGLTAVMTGGLFNFSTTNPNVLMITTQDYDASVTTDGTRTWKYLDITRNGWGGWGYGCYSSNGKVCVVAKSTSWSNPRTISMTWDAGENITETNITVGECQVGYGDPHDEKILFIGNQRTTDEGHTWKEMEGCDGVFISNPTGEKELYGIKDKNIVCSKDMGETWQVVATVLPQVQRISDVAYDYLNKRLYIACGDDYMLQVDLKSKKAENIASRVPADQFGKRRFASVAVDPVDTRIVYIASAANFYCSDVAVVRSTDGGKTWHSLTMAPRHNNMIYGVDGGREATAIRVNPITRYLQVGTCCYGLWKIAPPSM